MSKNDPDCEDLIDLRERHVLRAAPSNVTVALHVILMSSERRTGACISGGVRSHKGLEHRHMSVTAGVRTRVAGWDRSKVHAHNISVWEPKVRVQLVQLLVVPPNHSS